jgi:hypothetical protein
MRFTTILGAILLAAVSCEACDRFSVPQDVSTDFQIRVVNEKISVAGVEVVLTSDAGNVHVTAQTDKTGLVAFHGVRSGLFTVEAKNGSWRTLRVAPGQIANQTVDLEWPSTPLIHVRALKGRLDVSMVMRLEGSVMDAVPDRTLRAFQTDDRGNFDLSGMPRGLYFLKIANPVAWRGLVAVAVDTNALQDQVDAALVPTSCGLMVTDKRRCASEPDLWGCDARFLAK